MEVYLGLKFDPCYCKKAHLYTHTQYRYITLRPIHNKLIGSFEIRKGIAISSPKNDDSFYEPVNH